MPFRSIRLTVLIFFAFISAASAIDDPWRQMYREYMMALEASNYARAESIARKQLRFAEENRLQHEEDNVGRIAHSLNCIANTLAHQGNYKEAKTYLTRSLSLNIDLRGPTSKHLIPILARLADLSRQVGEIDEAADYLRRAMEVKEVALTWQKKDEAFVELAELLNAQCAIMIAQREIDDARKTAERAVSIKVPLPDSEQQQLAINLSQLGSLLRDQGESAQAVSCLEEARIRYGKVANADRAKFANCLEHLASLYREAGREQDAVKVEAQLESMQTTPS